jgi:glutamine synthetase type III
MGYNMDIFDGTIRHQQAIFMLKVRPILRHALDCLFHERPVFGMNPSENKFHGRFCRSVVLEDSEGFL